MVSPVPQPPRPQPQPGKTADLPILRFNPHPDHDGPPNGDAKPNFRKTRHERTRRVRIVREKFQAAVLASVTLDDLRKIMIALVREAQGGNISAAREVFDRCIGKVAENDLAARLQDLEELVLSGQAVMKDHA